MQMDTGNALYGGADPVPFLERYPGRARTVHLKEHSKTNDKALIGGLAVVEGRKMMTTPIRPATMAHQRRQPTASPKNAVAPRTTMMGVAWRMAVAEGRGVSAMART
jgi:hypothetical protein